MLNPHFATELAAERQADLHATADSYRRARYVRRLRKAQAASAQRPTSGDSKGWVRRLRPATAR